MALVRAVPLKDFLSSALSTTDVSDAYSTQTPVSGQSVYAALHLTAASTARSFVATIQSASSSGFGSLTTEVSFSLTSEAGSSWQVDSSPSTDRPWRRASWTLSTAGGSTGGSWNGLIWVGIR